jgi:hypothetical protein
MILAKLGRTDIMGIFRYVAKYMDDICWINAGVQVYFWTHIILGGRTTLSRYIL